MNRFFTKIPCCIAIVISLFQFSQTAIAQSRKSSSTWYCPDVYRKAPTKKGDTRYYVAVSAGVSGFGTSWIGEADGFPLVLDAEAAYFFKKNVGAGLKFNSSICEINIKDTGVIGREMISFWGPAIYGRFGANRIFFTAGAGVGMLNCTFIRDYHNNNYDYGTYKPAASGFVSAGVGYMFNRNLGVGWKIQSIIGSMKNMDYRRNPTGIESTIGIIFNF